MVLPYLSATSPPIHNGGNLRNADTRDYTGCTNRPRSDTDFDYIRTAFIERFGGFGGGDVAGNERYARAKFANLLDGVKYSDVMTVRGVDNDTVNAGVHESACAVKVILTVADSRADQKSAVLVLGGVGILNRFFDVFYSDKPFKVKVGVHDRKFFDAVFAENLLRLGERSTHRRGNETIFTRHNIADRLLEIGFETKIAVGENSDEFAVFVGDGNAADTIFVHKRERVFYRAIGSEKERIGDYAVFAAFNAIDVLGLRVDTHILVNDTHTAFARHCDCKAGFGNGIHSRRKQRNIEFYILAEPRREIYVLGYGVRFAPG